MEANAWTNPVNKLWSLLNVFLVQIYMYNKTGSTCKKTKKNNNGKYMYNKVAVAYLKT